MPTDRQQDNQDTPDETALFLCGDVMTGRGIDQILAHPVDPEIFEPHVRSASDYVALAERASGPIARPVGYNYVWGEALEILEQVQPSARIINLETAVTADGRPAGGKGIHYRMHPDNAPCLAAASIDCCVLANNHVLDWGVSGLVDTFVTLEAAGIAWAGAGRNADQAAAAATIPIGGSARVLVFAFGLPSSGIPASWRALTDRPGVSMLDDLSHASAQAIASNISQIRGPADIVIASLHWGGNWDFNVAHQERMFAHMLIDVAGVDIVHGHSSHHVKAIEVYHDRLILYGCGDLLNDYEGIHGHRDYRGDLSLMYFPVIERSTGRLVRLIMTPTLMRAMRITRARHDGLIWLAEALNREGQKTGTSVRICSNQMLELAWH